MTKKKMAPEEKSAYLESISFSNLVKAIDEKWSHTYLEYVEKEPSEKEGEDLLEL